MGMIPQNIIDQILDRLDIVEIVGEHVQLKKAGRNFKACCPFHNEKTPSFVVSPDKQIYHCFGCGAGGNLINFVMKLENLEFPEAVRELASRAGVAVPSSGRSDDENASAVSRIFEANNTAAAFFHNRLGTPSGKKALDYLRKRGITDETIREFKIGYACDEWEALRKYCLGKKLSGEILRKAGLTIPSDKGRNDYDRFRNRITFPIFNERGHIVGFGGRVMDDSLPKYINSPDTPVYNKSSILYGLNFAKKAIREKGFVVLVEGYMDVIVPYQSGIRNMVAASGTALTPRQVAILKKYTDTALIIFDADQAGEAASLRGLDILIENGMKVRIVRLPKGEDPDSYVRTHGADALNKMIDGAKDLFDYKLELLTGKFGSKDVGSISDEMLPTIAKVENAVVRSDYTRKLAERLGIHEESLRYELKKVKPDYSYHYETEAVVDKKSTSYRSAEIHLLGLAITVKDMFSRVDRELGLESLREQSVRRVFNTIKHDTGGGEAIINPGKLLSRFEGDDQAREAIVQALAKADITKDPEKTFKDCVFCVMKENREGRLAALKQRLKKAEAEHNDAEVMTLVLKINEITKEKVA